MHFKRHSRRDSSIPVVSMSDIAFLLIIFFLLTSTFMKDRGLQVLPEAQSSEPLPAVQINVSVTKDQQEFEDNAEVALDDLQDMLTQKLSKTSVKEVTIRGDKELPYGVAVRIIDLINQAGGNIGIATQ